MPEDRLIDPQWLIQARRRRKLFVVRLAVVFLLLTVLAWWVLPSARDRVAEVRKAVSTGRAGKAKAEELPAVASLLLAGVGVFKVFWVGIAIGCAAAALLALTGKIDTLVPALNWGLLAVGLAAVALSFFVFYLPTLAAIRRLT
jgi:hypothetical protein